MSHDPQSPSDAADMEEDDYDDYYDDDGSPIGCVHCSYEGWNHGCCDDMCRSCNEAEDCETPIACRHCNPDGESSSW